ELPEQPRAARLDLTAVRRLVDTPLPRARELEMLDHVGHVDVVPVDLRVDEGPVEQRAGRPDEREPLQVLAIPRLLAHEHQRGGPGTGPEPALRRVAIQVASTTGVDRSLEPAQARRLRDERFGPCGPAAPRGRRRTARAHMRFFCKWRTIRLL